MNLRSALLRSLVWLGTLWLTVMAGKRGAMGYNEYHRIQSELKCDEYFCTTTCSAVDAARNLGHRNTECHRACAYQHRSPIVEAAQLVLNNTYLCGDTKCADVAGEFLSSWRNTLLVAAIMLMLPTLVTWGGARLAEAVNTRMLIGAHNKALVVDASHPASTVIDLSAKKDD